jgi:hypothetical protein
MPCSDGSNVYGGVQYRDNPKVAAALCGILTILNNAGTLDKTLRLVDYKEAGISRQYIETWWENHQAEDTRRRAQEVREKKRKILIAQAKGKLSTEERKALGLE